MGDFAASIISFAVLPQPRMLLLIIVVVRGGVEREEGFPISLLKKDRFSFDYQVE